MHHSYNPQHECYMSTKSAKADLYGFLALLAGYSNISQERELENTSIHTYIHTFVTVGLNLVSSAGANINKLWNKSSDR